MKTKHVPQALKTDIGFFYNHFSEFTWDSPLYRYKEGCESCSGQLTWTEIQQTQMLQKM